MTAKTNVDPPQPNPNASFALGFAMLVALLCAGVGMTFYGGRAWAFWGGLALITALGFLAVRIGLDSAIAMTVSAIAAFLLMMSLCSGA